MESTFVFVCIFFLFLAGIALWSVIKSKINDTKHNKVYSEYALERVEQYILHRNENDLRVAERYMRILNRVNIEHIKNVAEKAHRTGNKEKANILNKLLDLA